MINDGSDNFDYNFGVKNDRKVSHNMILMSRYMGQLHGGRGPTNSGKARQCPKENAFFCEVFPNVIFMIVIVKMLIDGVQLATQSVLFM